MEDKRKLKKWILEALEESNGKASLLDVCKFVWSNHEEELKAAGDLFYTWQYDIRWAATDLRKDGKLLDAKVSPRGMWELNK